MALYKAEQDDSFCEVSRLNFNNNMTEFWNLFCNLEHIPWYILTTCPSLPWLSRYWRLLFLRCGMSNSDVCTVCAFQCQSSSKWAIRTAKTRVSTCYYFHIQNKNKIIFYLIKVWGAFEKHAQRHLTPSILHCVIRGTLFENIGIPKSFIFLRE